MDCLFYNLIKIAIETGNWVIPTRGDSQKEKLQPAIITQIKSRQAKANPSPTSTNLTETQIKMWRQFPN